MASNSGNVYNRDDVVNGLTSLYNLFEDLGYLPSDQILRPPEGGWPESDRDAWRASGLTETAVDLLAHLPYIQDGDRVDIYYQTKSINYEDSYNKIHIAEGRETRQKSFAPLNQILPDHVVALTTGDLYAHYLLVDTEKGVVIDYAFYEGPRLTDEEASSDTAWLRWPAKPIKNFFDEWLQKYQSLEWAVSPTKQKKGGTFWVPGSNLDGVRQIYQNHGWQTDHFDKEACRAELIQYYKNYIRGIR